MMRKEKVSETRERPIVWRDFHHVAAGKLAGESLLGAVGMQHIAFALPDEAAGIALRERLREAGVETTAVGSVGPIQNTLFFDNDGLLLEATWPKP
jgi:catechol 2,3-dioxygenase-like lactoylglutathione lyase family enzyme